MLTISSFVKFIFSLSSYIPTQLLVFRSSHLSMCSFSSCLLSLLWSVSVSDLNFYDSISSVFCLLKRFFANPGWTIRVGGVSALSLPPPSPVMTQDGKHEDKVHLQLLKSPFPLRSTSPILCFVNISYIHFITSF